MKKFCLLFIIVLTASFTVNANQGDDNVSIAKSWFESPHESNPDDGIIVYRLQEYFPVPGIDVNPDFAYNQITFNNDGTLSQSDWRWCDSETNGSGTWSQSDNNLTIDFGCKYNFEIISLDESILKVKFKSK